MVARLASQGISDPRVLSAMQSVPRHLFVDPALAQQAYEDTSLPIGHGQTISKPLVVARMLSRLCEGSHDAVIPGTALEIGTGCGYQAALLAQLFQRVVSVERIRELHLMAREHLDRAGIPGVRLVWGDGRAGHSPWAPYRAIIAAAGGSELPGEWIDQLAPGGCLIAPVNDPGQGGQVLLQVMRGPDGSLSRQYCDLVHFVPLRSGLTAQG